MVSKDTDESNSVSAATFPVFMFTDIYISVARFLRGDIVC